MTIEETFFKNFRIEKRCRDKVVCSGITCNACPAYLYPEITAEKLLQLICIGQNYFDFDFKNLWFKNQNELKSEILRQLINYKNQKFSENKFKEQVSKLFEE